MNPILLLAFFFSGLLALAAQAVPDRWSVYGCQQMCGLTENSPTTVNFTSTDQNESLRALKVFCDSHQLKLQRQPSCYESNHNKSSDESFQRCRAGIDPSLKCRVTVVGYKDGSTTSTTFYSDYFDSFDKAESQVISKCHASLNHYSSRCVTYNYYSQY